MRTQLLFLIFFGFLSTLPASGGSHIDRSEGEHLGGAAGGAEGVGSPAPSNAQASGDEQGSGAAFSFRYEPACADFNPPGTANSAAPWGGAGGTGLNDLSCNPDYLPIPPPPAQQAGEVGLLGQNQDEPKLVPPKDIGPTSRGVTEENPDR